MLYDKLVRLTKNVALGADGSREHQRGAVKTSNVFRPAGRLLIPCAAAREEEGQRDQATE